MTYRLDELGWVQFERLCDKLVGLPADAWEGRAYRGRTAVAPGGVAISVHWGGEPSLVIGGTVHGPAELSTMLDARPEVRRRVPSVLGVRDLDELIPPEALARSTGDVDAARALARVFVPTRAYAQTLAVLERHHFAVVTGPPEMGKTAIARTIGLALLTEGWELHECVRPEQLWQAYARDRSQLFVADDAFGSTEYRPEAAERWALDLDRVLRAMDERHLLIWTSRPSPLKAGLRRIHREHGIERFPQPAQVQVEAAALDVEEKALILFRHARAAELKAPAVKLVRRHGWSIVEHPHFTPERIRRFVSSRLPSLADAGGLPGDVADAVAAEIQEPTDAMRASLRALPAEHRALLVALLDVPPGAVQERELAAAARRHAEVAFPRPPGELLDRLTDHFVRLVPPTSVTWIHPSWRDLAIDELAGDARARRRFLERCALDGLLLALSVGGGTGGERSLPLLVMDDDWDTATERLYELVPELADDELFRLLAGIGEALAASGTAYGEAGALARIALALTERRWHGTPVSATLLETWFRVAAGLGVRPPPPELAPTWIELLPTSAVDVADRAALAELDEWLRLVTVLAAHAPDELTRFGFPDRQTLVLVEFLAGALALPADAPTAGLAAQCARRLAAATPRFGVRALRVASQLQPREEAEPVEPRDWVVPVPEISIVNRILEDLAR